MKPKSLILETTRLILRPFNLEDTFFFYELNLDPLVIKYTPDGPFKSLEQAELVVKELMDQYDRYDTSRFVVILKETNEKLGWCGLKWMPQENAGELGYRFYQAHWGQGYATESSQSILHYGLNTLKLQRIIALALKDNLPSIRVLEKLGFRSVFNKASSEDPDLLHFELNKLQNES